MNKFIQLITTALSEKKISIRKLSQEVDLDPSHLAKILSGKRAPPSDEDVLKKIASVLDIPVNKLILSAGMLPKEYTEKINDDFIEYIESYFSDNKKKETIKKIQKEQTTYKFIPTEFHHPKIEDELL